MYPENTYVALFWFYDSVQWVSYGCYDKCDVDEHCQLARFFQQHHYVEWL